MRRNVAVVVVVVVAGYALYPAGAVAIGALTPNDSAPTDRGLNTTADGGSLAFSAETGNWPGYSATRTYEGTRATMSNAGVYVTDYDDDGWPDVLAVGGDRPVLFENDRGRFRPSGALPELNRTVRTALFVDYDGDGLEDLLLLTVAGRAVFLANTGGAFERRDVGLSGPFRVPTTATTADYTGNGCPDVLVVQNGDWVERRPAGLRNYSVPDGGDNGGPNRLFEGDCESFEEVTDRAGLRGERWSLAASAVDLTGDGRPDIHVANDFNRDVVYVNRGDGRFERRELGDRTNRNGMSSAVTDVDRDGRPDLFVTNIWYPDRIASAVNETSGLRARGNTLLRNEGDGQFAAVAVERGVERGGWGWATVPADFDNDGDRELFHTTRQVPLTSTEYGVSPYEADTLRKSYPVFQYPALFQRVGEEFQAVAAADAGLYRADGRGAVRLDFDRDGDLDLLVANRAGPFRLYENTGTAGDAVQVRLAADRPVYGARVTVEFGDTRRVSFHTPRSDFLSQGSRLHHVGIGNHTRADVTVGWPDGSETTVRNVAADRRLTVSPNGTVQRSRAATGD